MRNEWAHYTLDDIVKINSRSYKNNIDWEFINYLDTGNVTENIIKGFDYLVKGVDKVPSRAKRRVKPGDILYSTVRPNQRHYGLLNNIPQNTLASTGFAVIEVDKNFADNRFIFYFLTQNTITNFLQVLAESSTSTYPSIKPGDLKALEINLPPLPEQKAIAHILGTLDDKIELNRRMHDTLEQMAQALFQSWFVDFDPVIDKALAAGNPIPEPLQKRAQRRKELGEQRKPLPAHIAAAFPDRFVFTEELGWIPEGWEVTQVGQVLECFDHLRVPLSARQREDRKPGIYPYYGATSINDWINDFIFDDTYLLLGEDGSVVKEDGTPFTQYVWGKAWVNNHAHVLKGRNGISTEQLLLFFKSQNIKSHVTGAVQMKLNQKNMNSITFLNATHKINDHFQDLIHGFFSKYKSLIEQNKALIRVRNVLLPRVISGDLRVPEKVLDKLG